MLVVYNAFNLFESIYHKEKENEARFVFFLIYINEPANDKTYKMACVPSVDSDQPGHPPSLFRVFAVRSMGS